MSWLIVGLGNPGRKYERTRHNVGWGALADLADLWGAPSAADWKKKDEAEHAELRRGSEKLVLLKPLTYMNLSGTAVAAFARKNGIAPDRIVVVHDDKDMALGKIRVRLGGSAGGHNGVKSIIERLGTPEFIRVKIGVGAPADGEDTADFVLAKFKPEEKPVVAAATKRAAEAVAAVINDGLEAARNRFN